MRSNKKVKLPVGISDFKDVIENNYYYFEDVLCELKCWVSVLATF